MDERTKKITNILLDPRPGMRVRLLPCNHQFHFGNIPLQEGMSQGVTVIKEIASADAIFSGRNKARDGDEEIAYLMSEGIIGDYRWWVYRHQFEILLDEDE